MSDEAHPTAAVYHTGLAVGPGGAEAIVFDLPGCMASSGSEADLCESLSVVIAEHLAWLDEHGDVTRDAFPFEVKIAERVDVAALQGIADGEFCFEDDLRPSSREDIETVMRRMAYARRDLIATVRRLPDLVLDWEPPRSSVRADAWTPEARTVRGILKHVANADGYYASNLDFVLEPPVDGRGRDDLFEQRERAIARLRALTDEEMGAEFRHRRPWQTEGYEHWTVRKALRRFIAHERFHTREIEQRLSWLILGAPEVRGAAKLAAKEERN